MHCFILTTLSPSHSVHLMLSQGWSLTRIRLQLLLHSMFLLHSCGILLAMPSRAATAKHSLGNPLVSKERVPTPNTCQHKSKHKRRMQHAFMHARGHHLNRVPRRHLGSVCEASSTRTRPIRRGKPSTTSQGPLIVRLVPGQVDPW